MIFRHFLTSVNESNAFIAACEDTRQAMLIDAGSYESEIACFLDEQDLVLSSVFLTHGHYDHTEGVEKAVARNGATVFAGQPPVMGHAATAVRHGDVLRVGNLAATVLHVPGHTDDSMCLHFPGHVFTGDALFAGSIGGTGDATARNRLIEGIRKHIFSLPEDTLIHPGHGPSSTVRIESRYNPFFV